MSKEYYLSVRAAPVLLDDEYCDLPEAPVKQPPTLSKRVARQAWKEEREMMFFSLLMRESTSYSAYAIDDLMSPEVKQRKVEAWQQQIERDRLHREQALEQIQREIAKHRTKTACQYDRQKGETPE